MNPIERAVAKSERINEELDRLAEPSPSDYDISGTALVQLECAIGAMHAQRWADAFDYLCGARSDVITLKNRLDFNGGRYRHA